MSDTIEAVFDTVAAVAGDVRSVLRSRRSYEAAENPSGEQQLAADVYADERLEEELLDLPAVGSYASEERDGLCEDSGAYHVACDPLDGSSNLQSNNGMGTIVGIYDEQPPAPGDALVAAGYVLYGPITTMVTAVGETVTEFLVEDGTREVLNESVTLPAEPVTYGFGGRAPDWPEAFATFVDAVEADRLKLRYGGAMVADVNQVMTYGGIFGYPMLADRPEGKLRLQFEGHPMAYIVEAAGGASSDGVQSLLGKTPTDIHERSPVFVGNDALIDDLESTLADAQ
ncbi:D-fructose 1,6-bisphosphatase [Halovenus aranensis]|uniref:Fructose-1,6-bisphosphatase class 1 n=1 Tax=Halovenus aranensis TaxID=890420 RepID=A0A1G8T1Z3_9EURY|nr:class 1 fructose-bisphosphatase [Halovenus aranensis]SDJ35456.1 D-fructose 1,6-bisphosphatase [Halovenus aranensis]